MSDQKQLESELRDSEIKLRGIINNSRNFVGLMSREGVLLQANRTALQSFNVSESDVIGRPFWECPWWDHSLELRARLREGIDKAALGERDEFEATHIAPDGSTVYVAVSLTPVTFDGDVRYIIPEGIDITRHKQQEQRLLKYAKELKDANEELEQFAYAASHDLRSPLRGIGVMSSFVRDEEADKLSEDSKRFLDAMVAKVTQLQSLLDDLLEYSRIGRQANQLESVDTQSMVKGLIELLSVPPGFVITVSPELPTFVTFAAPLRMVFLNLIGNAVKHHDCETGRITVDVQERDEFYEFSVSDDGPGIEEKYHEKVFEMFRRLRTEREADGSGMGLAMIRKVVSKMGGQVSLRSSLGNGTTFTFTWPRVHDENTMCEPQ